MYDLFKGLPSRKTSPYVFPELLYIRRMFESMREDVTSYYRRFPKHVEGQNLFAVLLKNIHMRMDLDDRSFAAMVEDAMDPKVKAFGLCSAISRGKVFTKGVTLGPATSEVVMANSEPFDFTDLKQRWRDLNPLRYLYHTRTDLNLPIMNNTTAGRGYGVVTINIPMMAVQYRYWLRMYAEADSKDPCTRYVGGYLLPNAVDSYLDIAFLNRLARSAQGIGTPNYPTPHPFYVTDLSGRVESLCKTVNEAAKQRNKDIEQLAWATPVLIGTNIFDTARFAREPVTRQNEWALLLARMPYVKYLVTQALTGPTDIDRTALGKIRVALLEAKWDNTLSTVGDPELAKTFKSQVQQVLEAIA